MGAHTVGTHRMADIHSMEEECKECKEWVEWVEWVEWAVDNTGSHSWWVEEEVVWAEEVSETDSMICLENEKGDQQM